MKILSIDTSSDVCSVCILDNMNLIKELNMFDSKTHSENLMPLVHELLDKTNLQLKDIECIVICNGPGSFTGIRIGISTVKAIAEVLNIPVVSVSSLDCLAYNEEFDGTICSLIDCRNDNVYAGIYDNKYNLMSEYLAIHINDLLPYLEKHENIMFVGTGAVLHKNLLTSSLPNKKIYFSNKNTQSAFSLGKCGYTKYMQGTTETADSVLPMYLRQSQAERMRKKDE